MSEKIKTRYPGVFYKLRVNKNTKKQEKVFYIHYRDPEGKQHHEKVGTSSTGFTEARANNVRTAKSLGKELPNGEKRKEIERRKQEEKNKYTLNKLWKLYLELKGEYKSREGDINKYKRNIEDTYLLDFGHFSTP